MNDRTASGRDLAERFHADLVAPLLARAMGLEEGNGPPPWGDWMLWPNQTLLGILYAAEALS